MKGYSCNNKSLFRGSFLNCRFINTIFVATMLLCSGCNKPEWIKTSEGHYFYAKPKANCMYEWNGESLGSIVNGKGELTTYKKGKEIDKKNVVAYYGIIDSENEYIHTHNGKFLGDVDNDMRPKDFGVLIDGNTIQLGLFEDGKLHEGNVQIFKKYDDNYFPYYIGWMKNGKYSDYGELYENGVLVYSGFWQKGYKHGIGKEYNNNTLVYDGGFSNNKREGLGKEYCNNALVYDGEWDDGLYDGKGTSYNENGIVKYKGEWKKGLYNGEGKLYENGQCIDAKWKAGKNVKTYSVSLFERIERTTKLILGKEIDTEKLEISSNPDLNNSEQEFIASLYDDIENHLTEEISARVKKRYNLLNIPRMVIQPIFRSGITRAEKAQNYFIENVSSADMQNFINSKIDYYNSNTSDRQLKYVKLDDIHPNAIVDSDVAQIIFDRESMEGADVIIDILVTIIVCGIIAFIIGFILGFIFGPVVLGICGAIDTVLCIIAFLLTIIISIRTTAQFSVEFEETLVPTLVDNYIGVIESQELLIQMLGWI